MLQRGQFPRAVLTMQQLQLASLFPFVTDEFEPAELNAIFALSPQHKERKKLN